MEGDDDLALAVVPLSTREEFTLFYNARFSQNSIDRYANLIEPASD